MELKDKKIAIFTENMFEDIELWYPYLRMKEAGAEVDVIAPRKKTYKGKNGLSIKADLRIEKTKSKKYDALIIPGGYSPDYMRRSDKMVEFAKEMGESGKIVAAICHGPWMLASAGLLKDKEVSSFFSIKDDLENAGAKWKSREVVVSDNIVTSRNPNDLPAFCRTVIEKLK